MKPEIKREYGPYGNLKNESYLLNGELNREDGPAYISYHYNGNIFIEYYYINGVYHREDGSAATFYNEDGSIEKEYYYINGVELTENEFLIHNRKRKLKSIL